MNILQSRETLPFSRYRVLYYFKRIEFQHRGSANAHILLWLEDAPTEDLPDNMPETTEMVNYLVSLDTSLLRRKR